MLKEGHVHLSPKTNTKLTKISKKRKSNSDPCRTKFDIVANLIDKEYEETFITRTGK